MRDLILQLSKSSIYSTKPKRASGEGFPPGGSFFCTIIDVLNVFFISFLKNQRIGVTGRSPCRLFPALSTLPANVKKPDGLLPISWGN
ncbi:hypothetical protein P9933_007225 [Klebsiella variicola]|uniref:hypothetical protein n=1 Tax=Klebsiella pneumoniae complex TaxID=3390273 RepID=UPI00191B40A7|nr:MULTISPECIES: hypothetical protein [Klebsiella]MEC5749155.1 hypothetical protein [Klebsiella variicola]